MDKSTILSLAIDAIEDALAEDNKSNQPKTVVNRHEEELAECRRLRRNAAVYRKMSDAKILLYALRRLSCLRCSGLMKQLQLSNIGASSKGLDLHMEDIQDQFSRCLAMFEAEIRRGE